MLYPSIKINQMRCQAEIFSPLKSKLLTNHSTGQLIPSCRAEALRQKRDALRRKLNRVADQIYNLKYDTEYQFLQLQKLSKQGEDFFETVEAMREKVKEDAEATKNMPQEAMQLNFEKLEEKKAESTDRSTERNSVIDSSSLERSAEMSIVSVPEICIVERSSQRLTFSDILENHRKKGRILLKNQPKRSLLRGKTGPTENTEHFINFCLFLLGSYLVILML